MGEWEWDGVRQGLRQYLEHDCEGLVSGKWQGQPHNSIQVPPETQLATCVRVLRENPLLTGLAGGSYLTESIEDSLGACVSRYCQVATEIIRCDETISISVHLRKPLQPSLNTSHLQPGTRAGYYSTCCVCVCLCVYLSSLWTVEKETSPALYGRPSFSALLHISRSSKA